jgi:mRNA-degrading endonuclease RelE of RelBE toxin-antitoxin system
MFLGKEVRVLLVGQAKQSYLELKERNDKESQSILRSIERIRDLLKTNPQIGDPISKDKIPDELKRQGINNLYRTELSNFWRMLYTIEGNKIEIFVFILRISDHPTYDKFLGYKGN